MVSGVGAIASRWTAAAYTGLGVARTIPAPPPLRTCAGFASDLPAGIRAGGQRIAISLDQLPYHRM
jgi:hypothetical protein